MNYLDELNERQKEAVLHEGSPLLILAGAGSGKTKTLTYKAAHLVHTGKASPEQILLVTFTNKAAQEMRNRVVKVTGQYLPSVGTFHSMSCRILRTHGREIGIEPEFVIYDAGDQEDLVKAISREMELDPKRYKPKSLVTAISQTKQEMVDAGTYSNLARGQFQEIVARVYLEYQKRMAKYKALDFDDLLSNSVSLLQANNETLKYYQDKFRYVFVDEYQDTNTAQYTFTKLIAKANRGLVVVGDASQSIYKWRGADYRNILKLRQDYSDLKEIRLERNYRSTQTILDAAHGVISNNRSHPILALWTEQNDGEKISLIEAYTAGDEARKVNEEIQKLKSSGVNFQEIAILYRTNAQSRAIEEMFIRSGIPYVLVGGTKFYERKEIKDVLAYLRVMLNPEDGVSYGRSEKNGKRRLADLLLNREKYMDGQHTASEILEYVLTSTKYLKKFDEDLDEDVARIENAKELAAVPQEFEDLHSFLENVALVQAEYYAGEKTKDSREAITLMTLHAAKGLEFRAVFMVGLEEGLFPHARSMADNEEMEEERRLMYVGITRAKERLYLSFARQRTVWGTEGNQQRSRFIDEIDPKLIESLNSSATHLPHPPSDFVRTKNTGIRIDALSEDTLDDFLSGEISVEELLSR